MSKIYGRSLVDDKIVIIIDDPKDLMKMQFTCPECGGHCFGSGTTTDKQLYHYCNTFNEKTMKMCTFRWMSCDDDKYFHLKDDYLPD